MASLTPEPADGREQRRLRHRERVYTAAVALFVERGFAATTMDDVAERAGLARATVFNHFPRKAAFVEEWRSRRRALAREALPADAPELPVGEALARYLLALARANQGARTEVAAFFRTETPTGDNGRSRLAEDLAAIVRDGAARGEVRPSARAETVGLVLAEAYYGVLDRWVTDAAGADLGTRLTEVLDIVLAGIQRRPSDALAPPT